MIQWEHKTAYMPADTVERGIEGHGLDGWEMVTALDDGLQPGPTSGKWVWLFFKRPKAATVEQEVTP